MFCGEKKVIITLLQVPFLIEISADSSVFATWIKKKIKIIKKKFKKEKPNKNTKKTPK